MNSEEIRKLDAFLKGRFNVPNIEVKSRSPEDNFANVYIGRESIGDLIRDDEDEELSWIFRMTVLEIDLDAFFKRRFNLPTIKVTPRAQKDDSAEVYIEDEFIGVLFRTEEEGDIHWKFRMAILDFDVEGL